MLQALTIRPDANTVIIVACYTKKISVVTLQLGHGNLGTQLDAWVLLSLWNQNLALIKCLLPERCTQMCSMIRG